MERNLCFAFHALVSQLLGTPWRDSFYVYVRDVGRDNEDRLNRFFFFTEMSNFRCVRFSEIKKKVQGLPFFNLIICITNQIELELYTKRYFKIQSYLFLTGRLFFSPATVSDKLRG